MKTGCLKTTKVQVTCVDSVGWSEALVWKEDKASAVNVVVAAWNAFDVYTDM